MEDKQSLLPGNIKNIEVRKLDCSSPQCRAYCIAELIKEDEIFFHGGCDSSKEQSQIGIFDAGTLKWLPICDISTVDPFFIFDKALSGHSSNLLKKGNLVVYGGFDGNSYSNAIYIIETDSYQFKQIDVRMNKTNDYPFPRCYHTSNYDEDSDSLYVYGGWNGNITHLFNQNFFSLWKFDFNSLTWEKVSLKHGSSNSAVALRGHTSNKLKDKLVIYGGVTEFNKYNDKVYELCLKQIDDVKGTVPSSRAFHSSCIINTESENASLIYFGGLLQDNRVSNEVFIYNVFKKEFTFVNIKECPAIFGHKMIKNKNTVLVLGGMGDYFMLNKDDKGDIVSLENKFARLDTDNNFDLMKFKNTKGEYNI